MNEARRRMLLAAMDIDVWLPKKPLAYAAYSNTVVLSYSSKPEVAATPLVNENTICAAKTTQSAKNISSLVKGAFLNSSIITAPTKGKKTVSENSNLTYVEKKTPPIFTLHLLQSGPILLLIETQQEECFSARTPTYYLLADILRAAHLSDKPHIITEPILWPILNPSILHIDQGPESACNYVKTVLQCKRKELDTKYIWLIGASAWDFSGVSVSEQEKESSLFELINSKSMGLVWRMPALHELMNSSLLKRELWNNLQKLMPCWVEVGQ